MVHNLTVAIVGIGPANTASAIVRKMNQQHSNALTINIPDKTSASMHTLHLYSSQKQVNNTAIFTMHMYTTVGSLALLAYNNTHTHTHTHTHTFSLSHTHARMCAHTHRHTHAHLKQG